MVIALMPSKWLKHALKEKEIKHDIINETVLVLSMQRGSSLMRGGKKCLYNHSSSAQREARAIKLEMNSTPQTGEPLALSDS